MNMNMEYVVNVSLPTKVKNRWSKRVDNTIILSTFCRNFSESLCTNCLEICRFWTFGIYVKNESKVTNTVKFWLNHKTILSKEKSTIAILPSALLGFFVFQRQYKLQFNDVFETFMLGLLGSY